MNPHTAHSHMAGDPLNIYGIPITLHKTVELDKFGSPVLDTSGRQVMKCGFRVGGGIDQDPSRSPQGYPDKGIYVTFVDERGAAAMSGLQVHDKLLQVNGLDFTMVTHEKACKTIRKDAVLQIIVFRKGTPASQPASNNSMMYQGYEQSVHNSNSYHMH